MARHESASSKPDTTTVASVENPTETQDQDTAGGGFPGMDYQVFEITDLVVPAGTDWSNTPHTIGTFDWPEGKSILQFMMLETSRPANGDSMTLEFDTPDIGNSSGGSPLVDFTSELLVSDGFAAGAPFHADLWGPWEFHLFTNRALTADITVIRARGAVLVV